MRGNENLGRSYFKFFFRSSCCESLTSAADVRRLPRDEIRGVEGSGVQALHGVADRDDGPSAEFEIVFFSSSVVLISVSSVRSFFDSFLGSVEGVERRLRPESDGKTSFSVESFVLPAFRFPLSIIVVLSILELRGVGIADRLLPFALPIHSCFFESAEKTDELITASRIFQMERVPAECIPPMPTGAKADTQSKISLKEWITYKEICGH